MKQLLVFLLVYIIHQDIMAQHPKIREADITYKKQIVRSVNLRKEENQILFGKRNFIAEILMEAVQEGKIIPYHSDKFDKVMTKEEFLERISIPMEDEDPVHYLPSQLYIMELGENVMFDKGRSVFVNHTVSLTLFIPEDMSYRGIREPVASFRYEDCHKLFRNDERAYSDPAKNGRQINFSEVFVLRLYTSHIVKIGGHDQLYYDQLYSDPLRAFLASQNDENRIREYMYKVFNPK